MDASQNKILVIDDEAVFREATIRALSSCGYSCISEEDPSEGIMRLKKEPIRLVLLDIMMEPIDGWDTLNHIRKLRNRNDVPIMMSSAKKIHPDEVIRYGEVVDGFITKPFFDSELCETISEFFSWYEILLKNSDAAIIHGVPDETCKQWIRLNREIRAVMQIKELLKPQPIIDDSLNGKDVFEKRMDQIQNMIVNWTKERNQLKIQYPVFSI